MDFIVKVILRFHKDMKVKLYLDANKDVMMLEIQSLVTINAVNGIRSATTAILVRELHQIIRLTISQVLMR